MLLRRMIYRQFLNKLVDEGSLTAEQMHAVRAVRLRPGLFAEFRAGVDEYAATSADEAAAMADGKFLLWLWEHKDEILAFILKVYEVLKPIFG